MRRIEAGGMTTEGVFKECPYCGVVWPSREAFMADADVTIIGYQVNFQALTAGIFLFNHSCRGTLGVGVDAFADLYRGEIFQERATGTDACPGSCLHQDDLLPCPAHCECAFVREIIQLLRKPAASPGGA